MDAKAATPAAMEQDEAAKERPEREPEPPGRDRKRFEAQHDGHRSGAIRANTVGG